MTDHPDHGLTEPELLALRPALEQYLQTRVAADAVEELTQEVLLRVWQARDRTDAADAGHFAVTIAANLISSRARRADVERRHLPGLYDPGAALEDPEQLVLSAEERAGMATALASLSPADQELLRQAYVLDKAPGAPPRDVTTTARLAKARARARVAYLLSLRRADLPSERCQAILEALSLGDRRLQQRLGAEQHLARCPACGACAAALRTRRRALFGLLPLPLAGAGLWAKLRRPPRSAQVAGAVVAVAVIAAVGFGGWRLTVSDAPTQTALTSAPVRPAVAPASPTPGPLRLLPTGLMVDQAGLAPDATGLTSGRSIVAEGVRVVSVPTDEGFWVGTPADRTFVFLTVQDESPVTITPGALVSFTGTLERLTPGAPAIRGLTLAEGLDELRAQGFYVETSAVG